MIVTIEYNREHAVEYAHKWALARNPLFYDFVGIGGNCTNFVSQCVYAGCCTMNYTPTFGWYYVSSADRSPSWTGVQFFYNFITENTDVGPYGREVRAGDLMLGDVIQLGRRDGTYYHTLIVTGFDRRTYLVSANTDDSIDRPLSTYNYQRIRFIHIEAARAEVSDSSCFDGLISGEYLSPRPAGTFPEDEAPEDTAEDEEMSETENLADLAEMDTPATEETSEFVNPVLIDPGRFEIL